MVTPPTEDANIVVPVKAPNDEGFFDGQDDPPYTVTNGLALDTIGTFRFAGVPFATRVDTLLKYLEKPEAATWEIVWVDDNARTDLLHGDKLKVTADDGSVKEYFIKVDRTRKSHNANLSSITWPDIPEDYRGLFGWMGDTIPNFTAQSYTYIVQVPALTQGIPALVAKNEQLNAVHTVTKATNLDGSLASKTATFVSTAEDDTTVRTYSVQMLRAKDPDNIQPWDGDAFISEWVFWDEWADNNWIEVANPRPNDIDMSRYMFVVSYIDNPADAINTRSGVDPGEDRTIGDDWLDRYRRYVPGYKWVDSMTWESTPSLLERDLAVNPMVKGGDVFVMASIGGGGDKPDKPNWWAANQCDVILSSKTDEYPNPWGENLREGIAHWDNANIFMYRIINDSVLDGLKPATDPADFTLIDVLGMGDGSELIIGGHDVDMIEAYSRKPGIYKGNDVIKGSHGTTWENSEWIMKNMNNYSDAGWPNMMLFVTKEIGSHFMDEVTIFQSTVSSAFYKVSRGYSEDELIRGVIDSTDVTTFLAKLIKADPGQTLSLVSAVDGAVLAATDTLHNGDTLIVQSTDLANISKYVLDVTLMV